MLHVAKETSLMVILQELEILHLLRWTVPGHHVQHHDAPQDSLLHREHHYPLHGHLLPHCTHLLPAIWQRREGELMSRNSKHQDTYILVQELITERRGEIFSKFLHKGEIRGWYLWPDTKQPDIFIVPIAKYLYILNGTQPTQIIYSYSRIWCYINCAVVQLR